MIALDMRTVLFANVLVSVVASIVMIVLWYQNSNKYSGLSFWVLDFVLQAGGALLIALRGSLPLWESTALANSMIVGGNVILYFGLRRFAGKKNNPLLTYLVLFVFAIFIFVHSYFVYVHDDLLVGSYNASIGLSLICLMCVWLLFKGVNPEIRHFSKGTGISFAIIILISLIRIIGFSLLPQTNSDFLKSGTFDTLMVLLLVGATAFLVFNLVLMVNRRLYSESKQTDKKLADSEVKYRRLFETAQDAILILNGDTGQIIDANPFIKNLLGYSMEELLGKNLWEIGELKDTLASKISYQQLRESAYVRYNHLPLVTKDGRQIAVEVVANAYRVDNQRIIQCDIRDITERKKGEDELQRIHQMLLKSQRRAQLGSWVLDPISRRIEWSEEMFHIFGLDPARGSPSFEENLALIHPDDRKLFENIAEDAITANKPFLVELRILHTDGTVHHHLTWCDIEWISYGQIKRLVGTTQDITERRKNELKLQESQKRFQALVETTHDFIWEMNLKGVYTYCSPQIEKLWGLKPEEMLGKTPFDLLLPEDRERVHKAFAALSESSTPFINMEMHSFDGTGRIRILEISGVPFFDTEEKHCGYRGITRDITERKLAEEKIRESEEKFRSIVDNSSDQIFLLDKDYKFLSINRTAADISGKSSQEMIGRSIFEIFPEDIAAKFSGNIKNVFDTGKSLFVEETMIAQGREFINSTSLNPVKNDKGSVIAVIGIVRDITDLKKADEERQRVQKLESIGTLAGGIAHDFNNLLTGILGNIKLADGYLKQNKADTAQEMLAEAEKASLRARDLTQQLLTFSRGGVPVKKVMLINRLIRESVTFALRGSRVKPEFVLPEDLWAVEADEGQLNQVINNLVINADQAMPNGGVINVSARNVVVKEHHILPLTKGNYVEIIIKDHGIGIPERNKGRIFEPYFTTKQKGSGLGLATSYSIINAHGGCITFESELGVGTTFHVYLPATKEKVKKEKRKVETTQPLPLTQGRILVMDDEEMIRMLLSRMLKGAGYEVELSGDGAEAVQKYTAAKESSKPFDAVILDLTVPGGMGGKEAIGKLLEIEPGVKAIVSSGYATDPIMAEYKKYGFSGVVTKPYDMRDMEKTLNGLLTQRSNREDITK